MWIVRQELVAQTGSSGDYFRLARQPGATHRLGHFKRVYGDTGDHWTSFALADLKA